MCSCTLLASLAGLLIAGRGAWPVDLSRPEARRLREVVDKAKGLEYLDQWHYIEKLGKAKDFAALTALYRSGCRLAANCYARYIPSDRVVAFCRQFPVGSDDWHEAFFALGCHPKEKVIGYIKQVAASSPAGVRYWCYHICMSNRWPELAKLAERDRRDRTRVFVPQGLGLETLGIQASNYLRSIGRLREEEFPSRRSSRRPN